MNLANQSVIVAAIAAASVSIPINAMASAVDYEKNLNKDIIAQLDKSFESKDTVDKINEMIESLSESHLMANGNSIKNEYKHIMLAANLSRDDSSSSSALTWQCYSNCHGVCHGARGWR